MKISINLLPPEVMTQGQKNKKFYKIQFVGIVIILFMVFLTSLTLALRILQSHNLALYQARLTQAEEKASSLKETQASLLFLQNRLSVIGKYLGVPSEQSSMYQLIDKLIPPSVEINAISVDKSGEVIFQALAPDSVSLESLIDNLIIKENNNGKINQVSIESLNRGRDGAYRVSFKIKANS